MPPLTILLIDPDDDNRAMYAEYLRARGMSAPLTGWLSPQMIYRIPRNLATAGIRALGRLAFFDHYRVIVQRLYDELLNPTHAEAQIGLKVLTPRELKFVTGVLGTVANAAYSYSQALRQGLAIANLANSSTESRCMISRPCEFSTGKPSVIGRAVSPTAAEHEASDPPRDSGCQ